MAYFVAGQGRSAWGETVPSELGDKLCWTTRQPVGVVGMITPWNFPVAIPSWKIFPALLAGNGVVIKPSEHAPACCEAFVAACVEAGVPAELIQVVHGFAEPAAALAVHPGVRRRQLHRFGADGAEGGGIGHGDRAPPGLARARRQERHGRPRRRRPRPRRRRRRVRRLRHRRPALHLDVAPDRPPGVAAELVDRIVERAAALRLGDPRDPRSTSGPVITGSSAERIAGMVAAAVDEGATVAIGGEAVRRRRLRRRRVLRPDRAHRRAPEPPHRPGRGVRPGARRARGRRPRRGPRRGQQRRVRPVRRRLLPRHLHRAAGRRPASTPASSTSTPPPSAPRSPCPFGGTKHTGNGFREAGTRGIEQFSQLKTVYVDYSGRLQKAQIDTHPPGGIMTHRRPPTPRPRGWPATTTPSPACCPATTTSSPSAARARGSSTSTGRRYLDLGAGIAVNTTGHCHPRVVEAIADQARTLIHTSVVVHHTPQRRAWPSASARCARSSTTRRCSSATRAPRRSTAR